MTCWPAILIGGDAGAAMEVSKADSEPAVRNFHCCLKGTPNPQAGVAGTAPDLRALTRAVRRGDADAFSCFYDLYSFRVYKFLLVLAAGDENTAREVCQGVFIKLAKRLNVFEDESALWCWLCAVARNSFLDHCRARRRLNRFVPLDESCAGPNCQENSEGRLGEILREALADLPPNERELIQAAYVDKRPFQELADELGLTYKAVELRLGRLRQKLKTQLLKALRNEKEF
jgi:RNA polymerase sigma-70 factor (ECF subfamily)